MNSFNTTFVCKVLQQQKLLDRKQVQYITQHENERRKSLKKKSTTNGLYEITAVDIISSFKLPSASDPNTILSEELIMRTLASYWKLPFLEIEPSKLTAGKLSSKISAPFARKHLMIPVSTSKKMLFVAVLNPMNIEALDAIRNATKLTVRPVISTKNDIIKAINECYQTIDAEKASQKQLEKFQASVSAAEVDLAKNGTSPAQKKTFTSVNESQPDDKNIVTAVNLMLQYACEQRASEIHLEPRQFHSQLRFRIDGLLYDIKRLEPEIHTSMLGRFKALGRLDISEKRKAQDGFTNFNFHGRELTLRMSTMPMTFGEKIMIRIVDPIMLLRHTDTLGFFPEELEQYQSLISRSNGIILISGPTGCGKTTTLYSTLDFLAERGINITTLEEPVELPYDRLNQIALHPSTGFTFESAVRHLVRQSPDVIMIGEIRDKETAANATQAALLGHLVFSTLHTYDATSALVRLINMGTEPFLVESTVIAVVAQRLLRRICPDCEQPYTLTLEEIVALQLTPQEAEELSLKKGQGCLKCRGTGYYGRFGIFEIMELTDELRMLIHENTGAYALKHAAIKAGMRPLREQAIAKMQEGITTCDEVLRITGGLKTTQSQHFKTKIELSDVEVAPVLVEDLEKVSFA